MVKKKRFKGLQFGVQKQFCNCQNNRANIILIQLHMLMWTIFVYSKTALQWKIPLQRTFVLSEFGTLTTFFYLIHVNTVFYRIFSSVYYITRGIMVFINAPRVKF